MFFAFCDSISADVSERGGNGSTIPERHDKPSNLDSLVSTKMRKLTLVENWTIVLR
jgi:hypothetical protein